jgi:hypothetical protein
MEKAKTVAKQAVLYLLALYLSYMFHIIQGALVFALDQNVFASILLVNCVGELVGFWILLVYIHFWQTPTLLSSQKAEAMDEFESKSATPQEEGLHQSRRKSISNHFSIFDGTNGTSTWAEIIYEGKDEDKEEDNHEGKKWADCVQT